MELRRVLNAETAKRIRRAPSTTTAALRFAKTQDNVGSLILRLSSTQSTIMLKMTAGTSPGDGAIAQIVSFDILILLPHRTATGAKRGVIVGTTGEVVVGARVEVNLAGMIATGTRDGRVNAETTSLTTMTEVGCGRASAKITLLTKRTEIGWTPTIWDKVHISRFTSMMLLLT
jgi:hypothetical protein